MKTIIAGSRTIQAEITLVDWCVNKAGYPISKVISGKAKGIDTLGEEWARSKGIGIIPRPADWFTHGKRAGYIRNVEMADIADACIVIWDGKSPGSKMMCDIAVRKGLPTFLLDMSSRNYLIYNDLESK